MDLWKSWNILRRRIWIVLIAGIGLFLVLNTHKTIGPAPPPHYVSTAKLLMNPPRPISYGEVAQLNPSTNWMANLTILSELMLGRDLLTRVAHRARVDQSWSDLRGDIELKQLAGDSNQVTLLQVNVTESDPKTSEIICKALVDEFIVYSQELSAKEFASTRKFLQGLVDEARSRLAPAEGDLLEWRKHHKVLDAGQVASERLNNLTHLQQQYETAVQKVIRLRNDITSLRYSLAHPSTAPPWLILADKPEGVTAMQERLAQARLKLADLERVYEPTAQVVRMQRAAVDEARELLERELAQYIQSLLTSRELEMRSAEAAIKATRQAISKMPDTGTIARDQLEYARLERQISTWDRNYQGLVSDLYRARLAEQSSSRQGAISVVQEPEPGTAVFSAAPHETRRSLPVNIVLSVLFGISSAFAVEYLMMSMHVRTRIEETLGVPVMGAIPRLPREYVKAWDEMKQNARSKRRGPDSDDFSANTG